MKKETKIPLSWLLKMLQTRIFIRVRVFVCAPFMVLNQFYVYHPHDAFVLIRYLVISLLQRLLLTN